MVVVDNSNQAGLVEMVVHPTDLVVVVLLVELVGQTGNLVDILVDLVLAVVQVMDLAEVVVPVELDLMEIILHKQQLVEVTDYQIVFWEPLTPGQVVAVPSTVAVMEEQVAPEAVVVVDAKMLILLALVELVDYLMVKMVSKHRLLILEQTKVDMVEIAPEAEVAVAAP